MHCLAFSACIMEYLSRHHHRKFIIIMHCLIFYQKGLNIKNSITTDNLKTICPGIEYLLNQTNTKNTIVQVSVSNCEYNLLRYTAHQGAVYGVCNDSTSFCKLRVEVSQGMFVRVRVQRQSYWCDLRPWKTIIESTFVECYYHTFEELFFESDSNRCLIENSNAPLVKIDIEAIKRISYIVKNTLEYSGYVIVPIVFSVNTKFNEELLVPSKYIIVVSVQQSFRTDKCPVHSGVIKLIYTKSNKTHQRAACVCGVLSKPPEILLTSSLVIQHSSYSGYKFGGSRLYFSTLYENDQPPKLPSGLFNCSVNHYFKFERHMDCNLKPECEDGRDETEHCPFSGPGCQGLVASHNKCFKLIALQTKLFMFILANQSMKTGERLASLKTRKEQEDSLHIFKNYGKFSVAVGYRSGWYSVPFVYSKFSSWSDNTVIYNMNHFKVLQPYRPSRVVKTMPLYSMVFNHNRPFREVVTETALYEIQLQPHSTFDSQIVLAQTRSSLSIFVRTWQLLFVCPGNHVTHMILLCDPQSHCGQTIFSQVCMFLNVSVQNPKNILPEEISHTVAMFRCDDDITTVHYTLVCDFSPDCPDQSDESFCEHPSGNGFLCSNGQSVLHSQRCNEYSDCLDDSDELNCPETFWSPCTYYVQVRDEDKQQHYHINLDGTGYFTQQVMTADESCPSSHYRCTTEQLYCLPFYTRCNGFSDCVYGEDEQDCERVTCPGFYNCRASRVCVHRDHLCDGWGQCPQRDDEWMCDFTCPKGCLCQGHSFLCSNYFPAVFFPQLRYMDATGSGMSVSHFSKNVYLIRLHLSYCFLINISGEMLTNLQFIDLANNHLRYLDVNSLLQLQNLRILQLSNNPLVEVTSKSLRHIHYALTRVDISATGLNMFNIELSLYLPFANYLNVSFSTVQTIGSTGFKNMPNLTDLDIRGNSVKTFPLDLLSGSNQLKTILSSNYRFCCKNLLPTESSKISCLTPHTVFPSCKTLIPSELYRILFWLISASAILGNLICFITSFAVKMFGIKFVMAIAHLQAANFCMGSHVSIAVIANEMMRGEYIQREKTWTNSITCKVSGFISFLSSEVSVLIIWFITLDHIIAICVYENSWRFNRSVNIAGGTVTWFVGILLSLIPFLPGLSQWGLHGQSGLCRLALSQHFSFKQEFKWFTVTVIINFILSLIIVAGQVLIYRRLPKYRIVLDPTKRLVYSSAHLMGKVAVTDAVSWFSFGLITMMVVGGVTLSDRIYGAMVVGLLPLNSALNPFLYMWTIGTQRQRQAQEEKLLETLKSRLGMKSKNMCENK